MNWLLQKFVLFFQFLLETFYFSLFPLIFDSLIAPTFGCLLSIKMSPVSGAGWISLRVPVLLPVFVRYLVILLLEMTLITCRALIGCSSDNYNVVVRTSAAMVRARALVDQSVVVTLDASFRVAMKKYVAALFEHLIVQQLVALLLLIQVVVPALSLSVLDSRDEFSFQGDGGFTSRLCIRVASDIRDAFHGRWIFWRCRRDGRDDVQR